MPRIPGVPTLSPVDQPLMKPNEPGKVGASISGLGDVGQENAQIQDRVRAAQDAGIMLNAENNINADMERSNAQLRNWTDYTHADEIKDQTAQEVKQKYAEQYGNRPDLWRHIEPYLDRQLNGYNRVVDAKAADLTVSFNKGALLDSQLGAVNDAANEPTIEGKDKVWGPQDSKTDIMVQNGTLTPLEGEVAKRQLRSKTIETEVNKAANPLNSPDVMQQELERLSTYEGKGYVDPATLSALQERLGRAYGIAQRRSDTQNVQGKVDAAAGHLTTIYGKDYSQMMSAIADPAVQKSLGLVDANGNIDTKAVAGIRTFVEGQDALNNKVTADATKRAVQKYGQDAYDLKMTKDQIDKGVDLYHQNPNDPNGITPDAAETLNNRMRSTIRFNRSTDAANRAAMGEEDVAEYLRIRSMNPDDPDAIDKAITGTSHLKPSTQKQLVNWNLSTQDKSLKAGLTQSNKYLASQITSTAYGPASPEQKQRLADASQQLQSWVDLEQQLARDHKRPPLQSDEIYAQARNMAPSYVMTLRDRAEAMKRQSHPIEQKTNQMQQSAPTRPQGVPSNAVWDGGSKQWRLP